MTRFDIPQSVHNVINVAISENVIDSIELVAMSANHQGDWRAMVNEIVDTAYTFIHTNKEKHAAVVIAAESFWAEMATA